VKRLRVLAWLAVSSLVATTGCSLVNSADDPVPPGGGGGGTGGTGGGTGGMEPECVNDSDCTDDGDPCTIESCGANGTCEIETTDPDDQDPCTEDSCDADGNAVNEVIDPNDDDPCTVDFCDENGVQNVVARPIFGENFDEGAPGWTTEGPWEIGPAKISSPSQILGHQPLGAQWVMVQDPPVDHSEGDANGLAGMVIGGPVPVEQDQAALPVAYYLTSPEFDATVDEGRVVLSYWRVLGSDYANFMFNTVEVQDGSDNWVEVFNSGDAPAFADSHWKRTTVDITDYANETMQIRFGFRQESTGAFQDVPGWSVDDVEVLQVTEYAEDGDACTVDFCDSDMGMAINVPIDLDDQNPCTVDQCDPKYGVDHYDTAIKYFNDFSGASANVSLGTGWEWGPAVASTYDPGMDTTPYNDDNNIVGVVLGGNYEVGTTYTFRYMQTFSFDGTQNMTGMPLELTFQRWLTSDYPPNFMYNTIDVMSDATSGAWVNIWSQPNGMFITDMAWMMQMFDLSAYAGTNMRIRVGYRLAGTGAVARGGWNLDDIVIRDQSCPMPPMMMP